MTPACTVSLFLDCLATCPQTEFIHLLFLNCLLTKKVVMFTQVNSVNQRWIINREGFFKVNTFFKLSIFPLIFPFQSFECADFDFLLVRTQVHCLNGYSNAQRTQLYRQLILVLELYTLHTMLRQLFISVIVQIFTNVFRQIEVIVHSGA